MIVSVQSAYETYPHTIYSSVYSSVYEATFHV